MSEKILIIGSNGMLGSSLLRFLSNESVYDVLGTVRSESAKNNLLKHGFNNTVIIDDILQSNALEDLINEFSPEFVLNCIGVIKQNLDSNSFQNIILINSYLPHKIARACSKINSKLIHFSTDCVFSGKSGMYSESDLPDATDIYGRSKLLGEVDYDNHLTLRTSIIGHEIERNLSLVDWFLSQSKEVNGFNNAIFSGLPTFSIAEFIHNHIFKSNAEGLYHLGVNPINKYDLLCLIRDEYNLDIKINKYDDFKINRSLNSDLLQKDVGFKPPPWKKLIEGMHYEYERYFK